MSSEPFVAAIDPARSAATLPESMRVARMHEVGGPLMIERVPVPTPGDRDVLVRVRSCGIVPNLGNILSNWTTWFPDLPLPPFPAVFGLDPAGEVVATGKNVCDVKPGDRVYVNPGRSCGTCRHCSGGDPVACEYYAFNGYFGFSRKALRMYAEYPYGGMSEYMTAPATALVPLPESVTFDQAARLGYIGTAYSALKKANVGPGSVILIQGASGTLGLGGVIGALALGARRILGTGRDRALLAKVKALAPDRIETFSIEDGSVAEWAKVLTGGEGVDASIDCLGPGARHETFLEGVYSLRRGGALVNVGATAGNVPLDVHYMMDRNMRLIGSLWFTTQEGLEMAALAESGILDLSIFEHNAHPLEQVNEAISGIAARNGGFSNYVIHP
ncbi:alcohol dehydrogenase catalytic domain-containing protein [Sphingobium sp.]|uniref:alcohol dehydrogenase catalytic domain-containing protein n=1 Tax=Sphingobium sp. TaxID=1912891 RepID=UPI0028BE299A|nr:alcohol dehydrogenase catalytic domain-containing protein [Sphingobium sp.]